MPPLDVLYTARELHNSSILIGFELLSTHMTCLEVIMQCILNVCRAISFLNSTINREELQSFIPPPA